MIDFRYHAISMVAVFLALAIGIVLGVTIGDSLVSEAEQGLRQSLEDDVVEARAQSDEAAADLAQREQLIEEALPMIAGNRLAGERVAVVGIGALPEEVESATREAVETGGGSVDSVSVLPLPAEAEQLRDALGGRSSDASSPASRPPALARRATEAIVAGGGRAERLRRELPDRFAGDYRGADSAVVHYAPDADDDRAAHRLAREVIAVLLRSPATVVGVEASDTEPSRIPFYERRAITTVDSVDLPGGQAALALALAGARGTFGFKETADELLPEVPATLEE